MKSLKDLLLMVAQWSIKMLVCFENWGAGSLEFHPVEFENKLPSESWREAKRLTRDVGGKFIMRAVSLCQSTLGFTLSPSPAVLVVSPWASIVLAFRGGKTSHRATYSSWGHVKQTLTPRGLSVASKSITLLDWAALAMRVRMPHSKEE